MLNLITLYSVMRNLKSEKLQSIFALLKQQNADEIQSEYEARFSPGIPYENLGNEAGENVKIIFYDKVPSGE